MTFHPLQMASAVLVVLFAIGLYAGTKMVPRQHVNWDHPQLVVQVSAMPI